LEEPHGTDVKTAVWAAVKRTLRRRGVHAEDFHSFFACILSQAEARYADWLVGEYVGAVTA
jgi:hypothetical protein